MNYSEYNDICTSINCTSTILVYWYNDNTGAETSECSVSHLLLFFAYATQDQRTVYSAYSHAISTASTPTVAAVASATSRQLLLILHLLGHACRFLFGALESSGPAS